jgi:hypothetical protein
MPTLDQSPSKTSDAAWRGFVTRFVAVFFAVLAAMLALIVLVDPYDSGRFVDVGLVGVSDRTQRTANVSLGRDRRFNAAIFGNSHGQLLDPERLSQATGLSFVQLTIPGVQAPEQIAMVRWFIRHHADIGALVLAADDRWCDENPKPWRWFPLWLYDDGNLQYLVNSLNSRSLGAAIRRIEFALSLVNPSDPRGYDDYEIGIPPGYRFDFPAPADPLPLTSSVESGDRSFPAIERLATELSGVPADTPIVIVFPPQYISMIPADARSRAILDQCKARFARLARAGPRHGYLDYFVDSAMTRDSGNFDDLEHYRASVARQIEREIADILNGRHGAGAR